MTLSRNSVSFSSFDNGSNYTSKEILQACVRLDIRLSHAPVRDGAAKGKIERFFRGFRDRFLTQHTAFDSLADLNDKTQAWIEDEYNSKHHSGIQMIPIDRFNLDHRRIQFLTDDETTEEVFFIEVDRKVSKTKVFSINNQKYECPVDLRQKTVQVRFIVYFAGKRMGEALLLNLLFSAARPGQHASPGQQSRRHPMIKATFGVEHEPFHRRELTLTPQQRKIADLIHIHSQHGGVSVVIGSPGVGKTVLREHLEDLACERGTVVVSCSRTMHTYLNLIRQLAEAFKVEAPIRNLEKVLIQTAFNHVRARKTLYTLIDEAHLLDMAVLRKLRLLFDWFLLLQNQHTLHPCK